jgi:hypothetical protein
MQLEIPHYHDSYKWAFEGAVADVATKTNSRIDQATRGLTPSYSKRLSALSPENASVICDYVLALRTEIRLSDNYRMSILNTLIYIYHYLNMVIASKSLPEMTS